MKGKKSKLKAVSTILAQIDEVRRLNPSKRASLDAKAALLDLLEAVENLSLELITDLEQEIEENRVGAGPMPRFGFTCFH